MSQTRPSACSLLISFSRVFQVLSFPFGLQSRGCPLLGIHGTPDLEAHEQRFLQSGWHTACARDMNAVYNKHIDPADRQRLANYLLRQLSSFGNLMMSTGMQ